MTMLNAIATAVFLMLLTCIAWWAFSAHRRVADAESAILPFLLPDETEVAGARADASRLHQQRHKIMGDLISESQGYYIAMIALVGIVWYVWLLLSQRRIQAAPGYSTDEDTDHV